MGNWTANPFDGCDLDETFALIFDLEGAAGLGALLAKAKLDRESLTAAADKLEQAGLIDAAKIVRAAAVQAATRAGVKIKAIMADDDRIRQKAYLAAAYRRGTITIDNMVVAGVDPEVTAFAAKARK